MKTGYIADYTICGVHKHICLLADDGPDAAQSIARRLEYQGVTVRAVTVLAGAEALADVERAAQGPVPGIVSSVFVFDTEASA